MKKKIIFCLLSLSLMIAGCQSNEIEDITPPSKEVQLSPEELLSIRYKSSPELSQTEVFNLLTTFQSSELKNNAHSRITFGIKEQIDTITNRYNKWLYLFHISSC